MPEGKIKEVTEWCNGAEVVLLSCFDATTKVSVFVVTSLAVNSAAFRLCVVLMLSVVPGIFVKALKTKIGSSKVLKLDGLVVDLPDEPKEWTVEETMAAPVDLGPVTRDTVLV